MREVEVVCVEVVVVMEGTVTERVNIFVCSILVTEMST